MRPWRGAHQRVAWSALAAAAVLGALDAPSVTAAVSPPSPECIARSAPISQSPATLVSETVVPDTGGRLLEVVLGSPAMGVSMDNYVLLPKGYDPSGHTRYPVLYLLHGSGGSYKDWIDNGVQSLIDTATKADGLEPFVTVMPDGGAWGYYSDWYGEDVGSASRALPPAYATYDIHELIPWMDANFPVRADRRYRAVAGLSMGGFGSMSYAARWPDLFGVAGSFSGAVDTDLWYPAGGEILNAASPAFTAGPPAECVWGDPVTDDVFWRAADPTYLASDLGPVRLFVASGNGVPGPYDSLTNLGTYVGADVESYIWDMNRKFAAALESAGVPFTSYFYGPGTHAWAYWLRDLRHFLPIMQRAFIDPSPAPPEVPFTYRTASSRFTIWGWHFESDRRAREFTYLSGVWRSGLDLIGSGKLLVRSPALYRPRTRYRLTVATSHPSTLPARGDSTALSTRTVVSNAHGELAFVVDLGPAHRVQQMHFSQSGTPPGGWTHADVTITKS